MPITYVIDGYNVLHQVRETGPAALRDFETARQNLIEQITAYCHATGNKSTIVFDGRGQLLETQTGQQSSSLVEILYSPKALTADAVIERLIYLATNRKEMVVVSGDQCMRDLCYRMGALVMNAKNFLVVMRDATSHVREVIRNVNQTRSMGGLHERIDSGTVDQLNQLKQKLNARK